MHEVGTHRLDNIETTVEATRQRRCVGNGSVETGGREEWVDNKEEDRIKSRWRRIQNSHVGEVATAMVHLMKCDKKEGEWRIWEGIKKNCLRKTGR